LKRENAANQDDEVKKAQNALSDSGASSTNDSIYIDRAALADLEKKINNAGAKWPGIESRFESANHRIFFIDCWKTDATGKTQGQWWITFSGRSATEWPDAIAELHYNEKNGLNRSNAV
jgi:hypothetical protein